MFEWDWWGKLTRVKISHLILSMFLEIVNVKGGAFFQLHFCCLKGILREKIVISLFFKRKFSSQEAGY